MRILFVTPTPPIPTSGSRTRLYNLIKQLAARHEVSVICLIQPNERDLLTTVEPYCRAIETIPFDDFRPLPKWENRLQGWSRILFAAHPRYAMVFPIADMRPPLRKFVARHAFDVIVLQGLYVVELMKEIHATPLILATENVESDIAWQYVATAHNGVHHIRDWLEWRKLRHYEHFWLRRFPISIAVSELDAEKLKLISPQSEIHVVRNGVDAQAFYPVESKREPHKIMFLGTLNYEPNAEGIIWFCHEVLPRVRMMVPDARLVILGKDPPTRVMALSTMPGVELVGFVPDVRKELWTAALSVVPLHVGGGTRLKILESLAAECPVVSTTVGAEGLGLCHGEHAIIADGAEEFAHGVVRLLTDHEYGSRLAKKGQEFVAQHYDWQTIALKLEQACARAMELYGADTRVRTAD